MDVCLNFEYALTTASREICCVREHHIQEAIQRCAKGRTVLVIAHRLATVENADRIVVIDKGKVVQVCVLGE